MLKKDYQILTPFVREPWKRFTFKDIKALSKKKSESYVYSAIKKYVKEDILSEESAGNVILYSLNLNNPKTQVYAGFIAEFICWSSKHLPFDIIKKVNEKIPNTFFTFLITGSYAKHKQKETSDLDIVIIVDDSQNTTHILAEINYACELSIPKGHPYVFKNSEYLEMLTNNEANYGKEIAKNNLIITGGAQYYRIINEAIKNGFNGKSLS
ncbi:MAG: nucleotidyltransferase domain-containing protein [Methanocellales archaeon]|nr:nucleotidyltransferase domain-containing protein [Methanocellales archaeon]MDD3292200.1 nucleotidyltransferase domain-containing protein [Methanocellales archaeon]MDD5235733.1 nucleotidyltransferase domain-containing protein [Methanocellales archaeon]MDD5485798.1 nucleotidyltransferase domain-containing protein [Methanocellales archaeon]